MARTPSAILKGGSSRAVKKAEKVKAAKADLKEASKSLEKAQKAFDKAAAKLAKLDEPAAVEPVAEDVQAVV